MSSFLKFVPAIMLIAPPSLAKSVASRVVGAGEFPITADGFLSICSRAKVPCGLLADTSRSLDTGNTMVVTTSSTTLTEALNMFLHRAPQYHWLESGGVIRIEPVYCDAMAQHIFYEQPIQLVGKDTVAFFDVYRILNYLISPENVDPAASTTFNGALPEYRKISVNLNSTNAVSAFDEIVKLDGMAMWVVRYTKLQNRIVYSFHVPVWRNNAGSTYKHSPRKK